jgi:hypothetical protein
LNHRVANYLIAKIATKVLSSSKVYRAPAEKRRQLGLNSGDIEKRWFSLWFKLDQQVYVAVGARCSPGFGSEQRQPGYPIPATESLKI